MAEFVRLDESALAHCMRRFLSEAESPEDTLAGFSAVL